MTRRNIRRDHPGPDVTSQNFAPDTTSGSSISSRTRHDVTEVAVEPNVTTLQSCPERYLMSQRLSWDGDSSLRLCKVFGENALLVILLATVPISCVLCVPLRSQLFFRSCCRLMSNFIHRCPVFTDQVLLCFLLCVEASPPPCFVPPAACSLLP